MQTATSVPVLSLQDLVQLAQEHQEHIDEIKNEVAQEIDNLNDPTPLFENIQEQ
jgi:hypothetical protein